ncbi:gamma-glutamyl-gamma-aminobutyrate hydrolase family protein [Phycicoccus sp. Soil802]|uniref:gamma-glutamyl-gamma-aminobutyrate hydrolase family protein n=1 Tax=Phycicoccus sp. Soil802 TaxID=1736414 RepID=UPI0007028A78|nr:gamma-glutamyl-gamma-aminobutyrate hydrolase family protein [Phycicoccus sp. Soil802]KRF27811.1 glutamine amidotransferase [Phycicoccus sp. Soil802]
MSRPLIGITCYVEPASRGDWKDVPSVVLPHDYVRQVEAAGGTILVIPPRADADDVVARDIVSRIDGLVIAGGADVDPDRYAAPERHPEVQEARHDRDAMELALATAAAEADLPLLGICRGMQVMAVAAGGVLEQHVPDRVGHVDHSPGVAVYGHHVVTTVPGTRIASLLGDVTDVPSYHHQSVLTHPGYEPSAWAADGTLEAMEDPAARFRLGVQWHPEVGDDPRLFDALVAAARQHRDSASESR